MTLVVFSFNVKLIWSICPFSLRCTQPHQIPELFPTFSGWKIIRDHPRHILSYITNFESFISSSSIYPYNKPVYVNLRSYLQFVSTFTIGVQSSLKSYTLNDVPGNILIKWGLNITHVHIENYYHFWYLLIFLFFYKVYFVV